MSGETWSASEGGVVPPALTLGEAIHDCKALLDQVQEGPGSASMVHCLCILLEQFLTVTRV